MDKGRASTPSIPDKLSFKIGEVSRIAGVKPHVLRYWETEFPAIRPRKTASNQRLYRREDVEAILRIKRLLYEEGFTIAGANRRLRQLARRDGEAPREEIVGLISGLRKRVKELLEVVDDSDE